MGYGKATLRELVPLLRQLSTLEDAGLGIRQTLATLSRPGQSPRLRRVLDKVSSEIGQGQSLHAAMRSVAPFFPPLVLQQIEVGETSGNLDRISRNLADYYEWRHRLKKQVGRSLIYPGLVLFVFFVVIYVVSGLMPSIRGSLEGGGGDFYFDARAANMMILLALGIPAAVVFGLIMSKKVLTGTRILDALLLYFPIFGKVFRVVYTARFTLSLHLMYSSGVYLPDALTRSGEATNNAVFADRIQQAASRVAEGNTMTESLDATGLFDKTYLDIMATAEQAGRLEDSLQRQSRNLTEEAEFRVVWAAKIFGGIVYGAVIVLAAGFILWFYMTVYGGILSKFSSLEGGM